MENLSEMIGDELADAKKYAEAAMQCKETDPSMADLFFRLANEEMGHMNDLHKKQMEKAEEVKKILAEYGK